MTIFDQGHSALIVSIVSFTIVLSVLAWFLRSEKKNQESNHDDHH